jgi:uncharacterized protein (DUF427 family)
MADNNRVIMVSVDFKNPSPVKITDKSTVSDLKPEPKDKYTTLYNRIVIPDSFVLGKLPEPARLDFVTTNPPLVKISNSHISLDYTNAAKSTTYESYNHTPTYYTLSDGKQYILDANGNYHPVDLSSNNLAIIGDQLMAIPNSPIFDWEPVEPASLFVPDPIVSEPIRTFATGAAIGLAAVGPQEDLLYIKNADWTPNLVQHTNFSVFQKVLNITTAPFLGNTVTCLINPGECGDLIGPMYLSCSLPPNIQYLDRVGVAIVDKYELYFDNILIDFYDSDWHTIYNDIFLSADEILALEPTINGTNLLVPLRFFFCKGPEMYLPICALKYQKVYIKIYFNTSSWITSAPNIELSNVSLIYDTVFLTKDEKTYYMNSKINLTIPRYYKEVPVAFTQGYVNMNITANFKVNMMIWFIRNMAEYNGDYRKRYDYGYISNLVRSYTSYIDWRGNTRYYQRVFDDLQIFINNHNIVSGIPDDIYYAYKQPIEHGLSVPDKNIYMYYFKNIDFSQYASKTTNLIINFRKDLIAELVNSYQLYIYYNGTAIVTFSDGYGTIRTLQ